MMPTNQYNFTKGHTKSRGKRVRIIMKITFQLIADARGISKAGVRKAVERGNLDLLDIKSIAKYILGRK